MRMILGLLVFFLLLVSALLGLSVGVGFLLHSIWPAIDVGLAILIAMIAIIVSFHFISQITTSLPVVPGPDDLEEDEEDDDDEPDPVKQINFRRRRKNKRLRR